VTFIGVQHDVPAASLAGWTECHSELYGGPSSIDELLLACPGNNLMLACRSTAEPDMLQLLAHAPRADVTFVTGLGGSGGNVPHNANGVDWYYDRSYSWGFVSEGAPLFLNSCDYPEAFGSDVALDDRLCWHTAGDALSGGWRCGADINLYDTFERVVYSADF
jgi:hypothetical protein